MNTPLLLTSVALLAGVAARPIENNRPSDDLRELTQSPGSDGRQAFLGRLPSGFESLNSLQIHDINDNTHLDNAALDGSRSPRLSGADSPTDPDPGLSSPYMAPQRYLSSVEQELDPLSQAPISHTSPPSSPASRKPEQLPLVPKDPDYSPMVVVFVISSLAAIVLLGLTVAVVYASRLLRRMMFQEDVWRSVTGSARVEKGGGDDASSVMEKSGKGEKQPVLEGGGGNVDPGVVMAPREIPKELLSTCTTDSIKGASESSVEDPDVPSLPDRPSACSAPTIHHHDRQQTVGLALAAWTYDNWVTHFMMALFGWLGVFFSGAPTR